MGSIPNTKVREGVRALNSLAHFFAMGKHPMRKRNDLGVLDQLLKRGTMARDILIRLLAEERYRMEQMEGENCWKNSIVDSKMYHEVS